MPEIKHNFTGGKMNKDLDERLIPNGEYRDALNIDVATSMGSNVGSAQPVLSNMLASINSFGIISGGSTCVGSISDEKNNSFYWFTTQSSFESSYGLPIEGSDEFETITNPDIWVTQGWSYQGNTMPMFSCDFLSKRRRDGIYRIDNDIEGFDPNKAITTPVLIDDCGVTITVYSGVLNAMGKSQLAFANERRASGTGVFHEFSTTGPGTPQYPFLAFGLGIHTKLPLFEAYDSEHIKVGMQVQLWGLIDGAPVNLLEKMKPVFVTDKTFRERWEDIDGESKVHAEIGLTMNFYGGWYWWDLKPNKDGSTGGLTKSNSITPGGNNYGKPGVFTHLVELINHITFFTGVLDFNYRKTITGINIIDDMLFWTDNIGEPKKINISRSIFGTNPNGQEHTKLIALSRDINPDIIMDAAEVTTPLFDVTAGDDPIVTFAQPVEGTIIEVGMRVTGTPDLEENRTFVSAINPSGSDDTQILLTTSPLDIADEDVLSFNWDVDIEKKHITVIKQAPKTSLHVKGSTGRDETKSYTGVIQISDSTGSHDFIEDNGFDRYDFEGINSLGWDVNGNWNQSKFDVNIPVDINGNTEFKLTGWEAGKEVVLSPYSEQGNAPQTPIDGEAYSIKGNLASSGYDHNFDSRSGVPIQVRVVVKSVIGTPPTTSSTLNYAIDLFDGYQEKLFEFKFPRFSYRYKYEDGEYSTFAPWTPVVFLPGSFDYHPRKGYNLGMVNRLKEITVSNFVTTETPKDVVEIDLLYKDDSHPSIYVVDTVRPNDEPSILNDDNTLENNWDSDTFVIKSDSIHSIVPSVQSLRHYDNVPRKALSQEVVGNRIIYGNYVQGYDLMLDSNKEISPRFIHTVESFSTLNNLKSIKSLRDYRLGIVFTDKYGRETPVVSNASGQFKVPKSMSNTTNRLRVGFEGTEVPSDMEYFKFFVKETSGEYYNMAMDRYYEAEDDSVWLAFPSADRSKLDEDTFLILKKGVASDAAVEDMARFKVISIENNPPDFIKTSSYVIGKLQNGGDLFAGGNIPLIGSSSFSCLRSRFSGSSLFDITEIKDDLHVAFYSPESGANSKKYKINSVTRGDDNETDGAGVSAATGRDFHFEIDGFFEEDDLDWMYDGDPISPSNVKDLIQVSFYQSKVENKPKFDGRFFVKIFGSEIFTREIVNPTESVYDENTQYGILARKRIYFLPNWDTAPMNRNGIKVFNDTRYWLKLLEQASGSASIDTNANHEPNYIWHRQLNALRSPYSNTFGTNITVTKPWNAAQDFQYWRAFFKHNIGGLYRGNPNISNTSGGGATGNNFVAGANPDDNSYLGGLPSVYVGNYIGTNNHKASLTDSIYNAMDLWFNIAHDHNLRDHLTEGETDGGVNHFCGYEDVMFIDAGTHVGAHTEGNPVRWIAYADSILDALSTPTSLTSLLGSYYEDYGIHHSSGTGAQGGGKMSIGIGPIAPEKYDSNGGDGLPVAAQLNNWSTQPNENFWHLLNTDRNKYPNTSSLSKMLEAFEPGQLFRWAEDPNKKVYQISQQVGGKNKHRFHSVTRDPYFYTNNSNSKTHRNTLGLQSESSREKRPQTDPYLYTSENYTKNKEIHFSPSMKEWDPLNQGVEGIISGGIEIKFSRNGSGTQGTNTPLRGKFQNNSIIMTELMWRDARSTTDDVQRDITGGYGLALCKVKVGTTLTNLGDSGDLSILDGNDFLHFPLVVRGVKKLGNNTVRIDLAGYKSPTIGLIDASGDYEAADESLETIFPDTTATYKLEFNQMSMNGHTRNSARNIQEYNSTTNDDFVGLYAVGYTLEMLRPINVELPFPENPAIWETEPKETTDLDIYYEISESLPAQLNVDTIGGAIPIGSRFRVDGEIGKLAEHPETAIPILITNSEGYQVKSYAGDTGQVIRLNNPLCISASGCSDAVGNTYDGLQPGAIISIIKNNGVDFTAQVLKFLNIKNTGTTVGPNDFTGRYSSDIQIEPLLYNSVYTLDWHNCYSFKNGVESNRIRDSFNLPFIATGVKASTTLANKFEEEHKKNGLIYSGIYNSTTGINNLNQFIMAEKITKDINPVYGSIQKLHTRDSDLVVLCEDKVLKILANKDAVYNADGNPQLVANENVLGQSIPFSGEYGISKDPASFASSNYRIYFADKVRGAILRLSKDGITPISDHGMKNWFSENLKLKTFKIIGSYDSKKEEYNVSLLKIPAKHEYTVSFNESAKGWSSFKSFIPENGLSSSNRYYTFKKGNPYVHHHIVPQKTTAFSSFYNKYFEPSVTVILNQEPGSIKSFKSINYEGSQAKVTRSEDDNGNVITDGQYYNIYEKKGWYLDNIHTDKQSGSIDEFIEKEGKWFNYIKGQNVVANNKGNILQQGGSSGTIFDQGSFDMQGLGYYIGFPSISSVEGCTANGLVINGAGVVNDFFNDGVQAFNYDPNAFIDDGTCVQTIWGCTDFNADNYYNLANTIDVGSLISGQYGGPCVYLGCMDSTAFNFDATATMDDGSCVPIVYGCTSNTMTLNYNPSANVSQVSATDLSDPCIYISYGCMMDNATNYIAYANVDDGSCIWLGCTIPACTIPFEPYNGTMGNPYGNLGYMGCVDVPEVWPAGAEAYHADWSSTISNYTNGLVDDGSCYSGGCFDDGTLDDVINHGTIFWNNGNVLALSTPNPYLFQNPSYATITGIANYPGIPANNYNGTATFDNYTYNQVFGTNPNLNGCTYDSGCTNELTANNFNPTAVYDDGSCIIPGCFDNGSPYIMNPDCASLDPVSAVSNAPCSDNVNYDDGTCIIVIPGCLVVGACNYDSGATAGNPTATSSCVFDVCNGCMDPAANGILGNYNVQGDDSQTPGDLCQIGINTNNFVDYDCIIACGDGTAGGGADLNTTNCCVYDSYGCIDPTACNYDLNANIDDGNCDFFACSGCMDDTYLNYNSNNTNDCAQVPGGSDIGCCGDVIQYGCMNPGACNYNPLANTSPYPQSGTATPPESAAFTTNQIPTSSIHQGCIYGFTVEKVGNLHPELYNSINGGLPAPAFYTNTSTSGAYSIDQNMLDENGQPAGHKHYIPPPGVATVDTVDLTVRFTYDGYNGANGADAVLNQFYGSQDRIELRVHKRQHGGPTTPVPNITNVTWDPTSSASNWVNDGTLEVYAKDYVNPSSSGVLAGGKSQIMGSSNTNASNPLLQAQAMEWLNAIAYDPALPATAFMQHYEVVIQPVYQNLQSGEQNILNNYPGCVSSTRFEFRNLSCADDPLAIPGCTEPGAGLYDPNATCMTFNTLCEQIIVGPDPDAPGA